MSYRFGQSLALNPFTGKFIGLYVSQVGNYVDLWVWENGACIKRQQNDMAITDEHIQLGIGGKPAEEYESANKAALRAAFRIILFRLKLLAVDKQRIERFQNDEHH